MADDVIHRSKALKLRTLFCDEVLDIEGIMKAQSKLLNFGIYSSHDEGGVYYSNEDDAKIISEILKKPSPRRGKAPSLPLLFEMDRRSFLPCELTLYPAFSDNPTTVSSRCALLFDTRGRMHVGFVTIYLKDKTDAKTISNIIKDTAASFPNVHTLMFIHESPRCDPMVSSSWPLAFARY